MTIPDPEGSSWELWAQTLVGNNYELSTQVSAALEWGEFADRMTLIVPETPRGEFFDDWQSWARALKQVAEPES